MSRIPYALGLDIGSVAVKLVLLSDNRPVRTAYRRFEANPFATLREVITDDFSDIVGQRIKLGLTGIGGRTAQSLLGGTAFGEIASLAAGNFAMVPTARTVIEMGGEDSKLLILDAATRTVVDFAMNAQCAAGTGSFLDQQAGRLKISIEKEFGRLALKSERPPRIAGRCSVFAKSDMIHLQQIATPDHDIVAGLCFAVARNFKSSIARGKKFEKPVLFEGGVAANPGMVRAFVEILGLQDGELIVPEHHNVMTAIGAGLLASEQEESVASFDPDKLRAFLNYRQDSHSGRAALQYSFPDNKHYPITNSSSPEVIDGQEVFLGIDVGSLSTNLVLIDDDNNVIARRYLMTEGRPIEAIRHGLREIGDEVGSRVTVKAVGATGSGRYLTGDFVGADNVRNEITAQATAAVAIDPTVDTIFEIGGQDSKYISLNNRAVVDFEMNKACAAGTGSFLQEQAEKLSINIRTEFGEKALEAKCPVGCGERCTVFMESDLVAHLRSGATTEDLVAGLAYSIASNYLNKVVGDRRIGKNIFFQGGVAWNKGVVAAFEALIGRTVTVPPHHDVTGAIGAAILAREVSESDGFTTRFKGFDLHKRKYKVETFPCADCTNQCEIRRVEIENEAPLFYGARCEKYEVDHSGRKVLPPNYAATRQRLLLKRYVAASTNSPSRGKIGLPRVLSFFDQYPFWRAFFQNLGYTVICSDHSNQKIVRDSLETFAAETCFPIKLAYGHVANLLEKNIDILFMPSVIKVAEEFEGIDDGGYICPYVQTISSSIKASFDFDELGVKLVNAPLSFCRDEMELLHTFKGLTSDLGLGQREVLGGIRAGLEAYGMYQAELRQEGERILAGIKPNEKVLVLVSRPYNGFDRRLSLDLPDKARNLGFKVVPLDFLPIGENGHGMDNMYWQYGRRLLRAANYIRQQPNMFAVYISSFGCGPDSFITHFFRRGMSGKPYLQLELDEHSADAGMITRIEAFVDSLRYYEHSPPVTQFSISQDKFKPFEKTIYIPNMCDHAVPLRAAMERYGLTAKVLDEPDELTLELGKKFTSGKECFPCQITTGDIIKKVRSDSFDEKRTVFFMPGANGPCRFGLYSQYHRLILDELGYRNVPIFSPTSGDGYREFGLEGTGFRSVAWKGMVLVDCLTKMLHQTRPFEVVKGESSQMYQLYLDRLDKAIVADESLPKLAGEAARAFRNINLQLVDKPLVGVVGEIYLRSNRFSNNHLIEKLERHGLHVWLATFTEWPLYTSLTFTRDSWNKRDFKGTARGTLQIMIQRLQEHSIVRQVRRHFPIHHDLPVTKVTGLAEQYLPFECKGEAILSIGKAVEMHAEGACGIVNAMPFNCMPGTIVSSLSDTISADLGRIPWLNISYEGLRDSGEDTRLEAFADQVHAFRRKSGQADPGSGRPKTRSVKNPASL